MNCIGYAQTYIHEARTKPIIIRFQWLAQLPLSILNNSSPVLIAWLLKMLFLSSSKLFQSARLWISLREINPLMGNTCLSSCPTKLSTPGRCFPGGRHYNVKGHLPREGGMKSTLRLRWRSTPGEPGTAVQAERRTHGSPNRGRHYRSGQGPYRFRMRLSV